MKVWWKSKTEIGAVLAAVALIIQVVTGNTWLDPALQGAIIIIYFAVVRVFTNTGITR